MNKIIDTPTFFDNNDNLGVILNYNKAINKLNDIVDWNIFLPTIEKCFYIENRGIGGRPHFDYILMFKILILQKLYNLSDEEIIFQIYDRLSFKNFLGISNKIPDKNTLWNFRETLIKHNVENKLFNLFLNQIKKKNITLSEGTIVDATFVNVQKQRNTRDENEDIKNGKMPDSWDNEHKISQKDTDASWTKKRNEVFFGYKNHIKIDKTNKLILKYNITTAKVHDNQVIDKLVDRTDNEVYADAGYIGTEDRLPKTTAKFICKRGFRNHPLSHEDQENNRTISKVRCRIEHVFATIKTSMNNAMNIRSIGINRAKFNVALTNLAYNMLRLKFIMFNTSMGKF